MNEDILGVLGGMGPEATVDFMSEVIDSTPVDKDQDHIEMVVVNDPKVPDRTKAILEEGEDPVPRLKRNAERLERMGANYISVPCNTFHYFYNEINDSVSIPIISMIEETGSFLQNKGFDKVGLLATRGTIKTRIYHDELEPRGIEIITTKNQEKEMKITYGIKAGKKEDPTRLVKEVSSELLDDGAEIIVAGCTELPLVLKETDIDFVSTTSILAKSSVERIKGLSLEY